MLINLPGLCLTMADGRHLLQDPSTVVLSIFVAIVGAYAAMEMMERLHQATGRAALLWLCGSAAVLGGSIWSMHFIGILAVRNVAGISYAPNLTALSLAVAVLASAAGLAILRGPLMPNRFRLVTAGSTVGIGVALMHYVGMAALEMPGTLSYRPGLFLLSIAVAIAACTASFWLSGIMRLRRHRALAAVVMGIAICGTHYVGMAATVLHVSPASITPAGLPREPLILAVAALTLALLIFALACNTADRGRAETARRETDILLASTRELIRRLCAAGEYRDDETGRHVHRLARIATRLAEVAGCEPQYGRLIAETAALHDIGKIGIPDAILQKPGKLTAEEWSVMQSHTTIGHHLLRDSRLPLLDFAAAIALTHHEKWDGSGYPHGLAGEEIPLAGRIVAIADVFDALLSRRPYKEAWPATAVAQFLRGESGRHFDPRLTAIFLSHFPEMLALREEGDREAESGSRIWAVNSLPQASAVA